MVIYNEEFKPSPIAFTVRQGPSVASESKKRLLFLGFNLDQERSDFRWVYVIAAGKPVNEFTRLGSDPWTAPFKEI